MSRKRSPSGPAGTAREVLRKYVEEASARHAGRGAKLRNRSGQLTASAGSDVLVDVKGYYWPPVPVQDELRDFLGIPVTYTVVEGLEIFSLQRLRYDDLRTKWSAAEKFLSRH